jgi:hypothetical protein
MTWKHPHLPTIKKIKTEPSVKKTMVMVFWDCEGLLLCEFLPPKTINSDKYCETLEKLRETIKRKRPGQSTTGVRFLHDGAQLHTSAPDSGLVAKSEVVQHPPHSPDLAP